MDKATIMGQWIEYAAAKTDSMKVFCAGVERVEQEPEYYAKEGLTVLLRHARSAVYGPEKPVEWLGGVAPRRL